MKKTPLKDRELIQNIIDACHVHAEDLLRAANTTLSKDDLPNIAYHLAVLALEEIGKVSIVIISSFERAEHETDAWLKKRCEDHVKKLFWALWGPMVGRNVIEPERVKKAQGLAKTIHDTRLRALYVAPSFDGLSLPRNEIPREEAESMIELASAGLEISKCRSLTQASKEQKENLVWFMNAGDDPETLKMILSRGSMNKLVELGYAHKWVAWLRAQFDKAEAEGRDLLNKELRRTAPSRDDAKEDKWKLSIRLFTNSHSIRPNVLNRWNDLYDWLKLFPVTKKKNQLVAQFIIPKSVPLQGVWDFGWQISRQFVTALNIGTMGFFWWYVPEQVSRYYDKLVDIETGTDVIVERLPALELDWKHGVLSERGLYNSALCFGLLPHPSERRLHKPFDEYLTGLAFLAKNDVHFQFEANAFEQFYRAMKTGMRAYGDWAEATPFKSAFDALIAEILPIMDDSDKYLQLGEKLLMREKLSSPITLSEVGAMKILCDAYFHRTFKRLAEERNVPSGDPQDADSSEDVAS